MVPNGWEETRLKHIARIKSGSTPLRAKQDLYYSQDGTPWVKTLDLNNAEIFETDERITELALKETSCSIFPVNTVLVAMYGGFNQIGRTGLLTVPSAINQALSGLMLDGTKADSKYILNYLNGNVRQWKKFAASSRKDPNITREDVCNFEVLLPPLPEQRKIAKILSTWDKAIATTEKLIDASQQQKKALMQQLLTGKKRLLDKNGVRFSGDWNALNLGEILSKVSNGVTYDAKNIEGLPVTRIETISTGKVNFNKVGFAPDEENTRRFKLHQGDILYSHINSLEHIGRVAYFNDARPLYHGMNLLLLRTGEKHDSLYIYYLLGSELGKKYAKSYAKSAVNQASISTTDVKAFRFLIPNLTEQQKIASVLTAADKEIELLQAKLAHLKDEKKALMQQLLTGKRRVKVDENVTA
ncbi:restriction endonuclease subunit S [Providencia stuartii]|uniref:restriction endonuclease subunit S n=1 Tax=Providencia stuartii TaxID=588 RepID=UPI0025AB1654|nr:restriction endonuclease subunit S [Providencia stuartii]MDN0021221.1 restriction endonuclease subunit S [Providencia stuartii]